MHCDEIALTRVAVVVNPPLEELPKLAKQAKVQLGGSC
jgi:hypothetical protein